MLGRRLLSYGLDLALVLCAALGAILLSFRSPLAVPVIAAALAAITVRLVVRRIRRRTVPLARAVVARGVVLLAVGIAQVNNAGADARLPALLGTTILFGLLVSERVLNRLGTYRPPIVANLPGIAPAPRRPEASTGVVLASLLSCAAGLLSLGHSPSWWLGVLC